MSEPFPSEPSRIGSTVPPTGGVSRPIGQPVDAATLNLLVRWQREDATADRAQISAAEEELVEFKAAVNNARTASGEPPVYP